MNIRMNKVVLSFLVCVSASSALAKIEAVLGSVSLKSNPNIASLPTTNESEIILSRDQYVISYNKNHRSPNWVSWKLEASDLGNSGRTNKFSQDSDLETYLAKKGQNHAVTPEEYAGSCFDRGHQIPSADRTDNREDNQATFMMSNMIPQTPYLNRVIWEHLENYERTLVRSGKKLYIVAGPIFDTDFGSIGPNSDILVPSKDFKVIFILDSNQTAADITANTPTIAVVMPNTLEDGSASPIDTKSCPSFSSPKSGNMNDWEQYKTSISDVEQLSGISFNL